MVVKQQRKNTYREIYNLVEEAVFQYQFDLVGTCRYVRDWTGIRNLDEREIWKIMNRVATSYQVPSK